MTKQTIDDTSSLLTMEQRNQQTMEQRNQQTMEQRNQQDVSCQIPNRMYIQRLTQLRATSTLPYLG